MNYAHKFAGLIVAFAVCIAACENGGIVADAGEDLSVQEGAMVSLTGAGSASEFSWTQLSGPAVTLIGADTADVSFEAPWIVEESVSLELELTVSDGANSATDTVEITVTNTHYLLFIADKDPPGRFELYRAPLDEETEPIKVSQTPVPGGDVQSFSASPDGRYVAYLGDIERVDVDELFVAPADGSGGSVKVNGPILAEGGDVFDFEWSSDSTHIAYRAEEETDLVAEVYSNTPDGNAHTKVNGALVAGGRVREFNWSPDGSRIAYVADQETDNIFELFTSAPDGSENLKVNGPLVTGGDVEDLYEFHWSPDSTRIAYVADQETDNVFELFTSAPDGSANVKIASVERFQWSPDASRIAYLDDQDTPGLRELFAELADGSGTSVKLNGPLLAGGRLLDLGDDLTWKWSPDGSRIAYLAYLETLDTVELFSSAADGSNNVKVNGPLVPGDSLLGPFGEFRWKWSPDGSRIAYLTYQETSLSVELFIGVPDGSATVKIADQPGDFQWSPDGAHIAYLAYRETDWVPELFSSAANGSGNVKVSGSLVRDGRVFGFQWSPDNMRIVYVADQDTSRVVEIYSSAPDGSDNIKLSGTPPLPFGVPTRGGYSVE